MFMLAANDGGGTGLHHRTALIACGIVACNQWNGYLSAERYGPPLSEPFDALLTGSQYFYHVRRPSLLLPGLPSAANEDPKTTEPLQYPICPRFADWSFPHDNLPPTWPAARDTTHDRVVPLRHQAFTADHIDGGCVVTADIDRAACAYLVPAEHWRWYGAERMQRYAESDNGHHGHDGGSELDVLANKVTLRPDVCAAFGALDWAPVYKLDRWVAHFFGATNTIGAQHHQRTLRLQAEAGAPSRLAPQLLLARFAMAVLKQLGTFVNHQKSEGLVVRMLDDSKGARVHRIVTLDSDSDVPGIHPPYRKRRRESDSESEDDY
jgi:hypothetical protein